jgi:hypothetical protein
VTSNAGRWPYRLSLARVYQIADGLTGRYGLKGIGHKNNCGSQCKLAKKRRVCLM